MRLLYAGIDDVQAIRMSRWWRAYDEAVDDPKLCLLNDKQHRAWFNLCCITSQNGGTLPPIAAVAFKLRMPIMKAKHLIAELVTLGLIDQDETAFTPHNWNARQYKSDVTDPTAASRQKTYRERNKHRNGDRNAAVTNTDTRADTEQITEADTEQSRKKTTRADAPEDDWPKEYGDLFWKAYPRKTEKLAAMKRLSNVRKSRIVTFADLMAGVNRYAIAVANSDPQYTKHPTTWLNAGCWADETQPGGRNGARDFDQKRGSSSSDFFAGMRGLAADLARDGQPSGPAAEEVPLGRVNIEH